MIWKNILLVKVIESSLFEICFMKPECSAVKYRLFCIDYVQPNKFG